MTEVSSSSEVRHDIRPLTSLRFFAASWVVLYHFRPHVEAMFPAWRHARPLVESGYLGVDLFFVLSGFIITHNYADRLARPTLAAYRRFLALRLARLYPVHLVTLLAVLALVVGAGVTGHSLNGSFTAQDFVRQLLLLGAWGSSDDPFTWNYPAWSISAEWAAYLCFPLLAVVMRRVRSLPAALAGGCAVLAGYFALTGAGVPNHPLLRIAAEFTAGFLLCRVYDTRRRGPGWDVGALATLVVGLGVLLWARAAAPQVLVVLFALLILCLALSDGPVRRVMSRPSWVFLGEASYSLYMVHAVVEMAGRKVAPMEAQALASTGTRLAVVVGYTVVLLGAAVALHLVVERPARDRWRGALHQRRRAATA